MEYHNALAAVRLGVGWAALAEYQCKELADTARRMFEITQTRRGTLAYEVQESQVGITLVQFVGGDRAKAGSLLRDVISNATTAHDTRTFAQHILTAMPDANPQVAPAKYT